MPDDELEVELPKRVNEKNNETNDLAKKGQCFTNSADGWLQFPMTFVGNWALFSTRRILALLFGGHVLLSWSLLSTNPRDRVFFKEQDRHVKNDASLFVCQAELTSACEAGGLFWILLLYTTCRFLCKNWILVDDAWGNNPMKSMVEEGWGFLKTLFWI